MCVSVILEVKIMEICPECSKIDLKRMGKQWRMGDNGVRYRVQLYQCKFCGRIFREKIKEGK
jgi:rubredoxin